MTLRRGDDVRIRIKPDTWFNAVVASAEPGKPVVFVLDVTADVEGCVAQVMLLAVWNADNGQWLDCISHEAVEIQRTEAK